MADEIKNVYKYIDNDIDRDLLVNNLNHNAQRYVDSRNWDQGRIDEFYNALDQYIDAINEGRISSTRSGSLYDSAGILDNGTANYRDSAGNIISPEDYNNLRKRQVRKQGITNDFYANREVASFINSIARGLYNKVKDGSTDKSAAFDLIKNGVWNSFLDSLTAGNNGNFDTDAWLELDPYNEETGLRGTTERAKALSNYITDYINGLDPNLDFKGSTFGSRDAYIQRLKDLQLELATNGVDAADFRLLSALGANPDQYRAFFTTNKTFTPVDNSPEAVAAREAEAKEKKAKEEKNALANQVMDMYRQAAYQAYGNGTAPTGVIFTPKKDEDEITAYINELNAHNIRMNPNTFRTTTGEEFSPYLEQYGEMVPDAIQEVVMGPYAGWRYIKGSQNNGDYSVLGYNPTTHQVMRLPYWALGPEGRQAFIDYIEQLYGYNTSMNQPLFQEGGVLPVAEPLSAEEFFRRQQQQSRETRNDPTRRQVGQPANDYSDNKFSNEDIMRLSSAMMDIGALISPGAVSSLGLGLGSDVTNFVADMREGYGLGKSLGNFAMNLGLSAFGIIPVFGQGLGSGSKVVKALVKLAPKLGKIAVATGVINAIENGPELLASLNKIGKSGTENRMDARDWRNVMLLIQTVIGGSNAFKNTKVVKGINSELAKTTKGAVRVDTVNTKTGQTERLVFDNKESGVGKELLDAYATGDPTKVNQVLHRYNSLADHEVITKDHVTRSKASGEEGFKWFDPRTWTKTTKSSGIVEGAVGDMIYPGEVQANLAAGRVEDIGFGDARMRNVIEHRLGNFAEPGQRFGKGNPYRNITTAPARTLAEVQAAEMAAAEARAAAEATRTAGAAGTAAGGRAGSLSLAAGLTGVKTPSSKTAIKDSVTKMSSRDLITNARAEYSKLTEAQIKERAGKGEYSDYFRQLLELRAKANPGMSRNDIIRNLIGHGYFRQGGQIEKYDDGGKKKTTEQIIRQMRRSFI